VAARLANARSNARKTTHVTSPIRRNSRSNDEITDAIQSSSGGGCHRPTPDASRSSPAGGAGRCSDQDDRDFQALGLGGIDTASAMLAPLYRNVEALGTDDYEAYVVVTLPIFRMFSPKARIGIIAHEFAHSVRALKLAPGWERKMQARYAANEKLANAQAIRWGFGEEIKTNHRERHKTINPWLEAQTPKILRRMTEKYRRDWEQQMQQRKQSSVEGRS
jgi:hypothetical protein